MIPKIIHFCWLSDDPIPDNLKNYMNTWKKYLPEYQIIHWDFNRFDKNSSLWVQQAFDNKKYAFAADYIRLFALYEYGGIYLDMDVEVLKTFNSFLELNTMICWQNSSPGLEAAIVGTAPKQAWVRKCLEYYQNRPFIKENGEFDTLVLPEIIESCLKRNNFKLKNCTNIDEALNIEKGENLIPVFPYTFFSPKSYATNKIEKTNDSVCIHHFAASWKSPYVIAEKKFWDFLGCKNYAIINRIINLKRKILFKLKRNPNR
ncbi:glycosyltransferase [Phocaeicola barnesiae]|uniref:glycosyltransferase family 32 protein n=1 Tax=Phocaeicola barnesiae TaxID=376804 RepID=UPI0025A3FEFC|nr:glycosyltransferase [Phocaeicola barnesiae]MDM8234661.1 glycosyltransferase [Phocaeicola barnesiae]